MIACQNSKSRHKRFFLFHQVPTSALLLQIFLCLFRPILASNEPVKVFFNFLNFFTVVLEFSTSRRVGTERKDNSYFHSFTSFSNLFFLEMNP